MENCQNFVIGQLLGARFQVAAGQRFNLTPVSHGNLRRFHERVAPSRAAH